MKNTMMFVLLNVYCVSTVFGQQSIHGDDQEKAIASLIHQYSQARETRDTALLKKILTTDVDQLVSTGEWHHSKNVEQFRRHC